MVSFTIFNGCKHISWYEGEWIWKAMVSNWAFYEDAKYGRLRSPPVGYSWNKSLYAAAGRWVHTLSLDGVVLTPSAREVEEGFKELIGL